MINFEKKYEIKYAWYIILDNGLVDRSMWVEQFLIIFYFHCKTDYL